MKEERSAGMVIFYQELHSSREYLLLQYGSGYWDLPKGKLEEGETDIDAAIREVKEETNLDLKPYGDFKQTISYFFKDREGEIVHKTVQYFCAQATQKGTVQVSDEHLAFVWTPLKEALKKLTYTNSRQLLQMVNEYLSQPNNN